MPFSTLLQIMTTSAPIIAFCPGVLSTSIPHNILFKPLATFPHNMITETMCCGERGMNPIAMTIARYCPSPESKQQHPVLKS